MSPYYNSYVYPYKKSHICHTLDVINISTFQVATHHAGPFLTGLLHHLLLKGRVIRLVVASNPRLFNPRYCISYVLSSGDNHYFVYIQFYLHLLGHISLVCTGAIVYLLRHDCSSPDFHVCYINISYRPQCIYFITSSLRAVHT